MLSGFIVSQLSAIAGVGNDKRVDIVGSISDCEGGENGGERWIQEYDLLERCLSWLFVVNNGSDIECRSIRVEILPRADIGLLSSKQAGAILLVPFMQLKWSGDLVFRRHVPAHPIASSI